MTPSVKQERSHQGDNISGYSKESSLQGEFTHDTACKKKITFLNKKKGQRAKQEPQQYCAQGKAYKRRKHLLHFFTNRPDIEVVLALLIFMILYLQSSFCFSATWFSIYRWLWDHSLLFYSNITNKYISSTCINRDLSLCDTKTKMQNLSRHSWLLLSVILLDMSYTSSTPLSILAVFGISPLQLYQGHTVIFLVFE